MIKECFKCGFEKDLDDFYKHPEMADGHLNKCKECTKVDSNRHREENIKKVRAYDRERAKTTERRKHSTENTRRWRKKKPEGYKAHMIVRNSVRAGDLSPPFHCQRCGKKERLHAHHKDYNKPLEVEWLCPVCHFN